VNQDVRIAGAVPCKPAETLRVQRLAARATYLRPTARSPVGELSEAHAVTKSSPLQLRESELFGNPGVLGGDQAIKERLDFLDARASTPQLLEYVSLDGVVHGLPLI
jgi:hypothetical protein